MTRLLAVNSNNDIFVTGSNRLAIVTDLDAVLQNCEHVMRAQLGEMIFARQRGIDYLNNVFNGNPNFLIFESQARNAILSVSEVISISNFSAAIVNDRLEYSATIQTTFGVGAIDGNI